MSDETISDIETKALKNVPRFVWSFAGISVVFTALLMTNGIFLGQHLNAILDIYVEEKRAAIESKVDYLKVIDNQNIVLANLKAELNDLKKQVKENTKLAHRSK